jgi:hypothetical protein
VEVGGVSIVPPLHKPVEAALGPHGWQFEWLLAYLHRQHLQEANVHCLSQHYSPVKLFSRGVRFRYVRRGSSTPPVSPLSCPSQVRSLPLLAARIVCALFVMKGNPLIAGSRYH